MATETERKFLLRDDSWLADVRTSTRIRQAYLANNERSSVRIRIAGEQASINIKQMLIGPSRSEYEYPINLKDAREMFERLCFPSEIAKTRHYLDIEEHTWEIDVFEGDNKGLVVAEIELDSVEEIFEKPPWLGEEVTSDERYYNVSLANFPYTSW